MADIMVERVDHLKLIRKINAGDVAGLRQLLTQPRFLDVIDCPDRNGSTPLFYAAWHGSVEMCRLLIQRGADVFKQVRKFRAIHIATSQNRVEVVRLLVEHGDHISARDVNKMMQKGIKVHPDIFALARTGVTTARKAPPLLPPQDNDAGLFLAAKSGNIGRAAQLLQAGANVNAVGQGAFAGLTPLHVASKNSQYEMVLFLVKRGAQFAAEAAALATGQVAEQRTLSTASSVPTLPDVRQQDGEAEKPMRDLHRALQDVFNQAGHASSVPPSASSTARRATTDKDVTSFLTAVSVQMQAARMPHAFA